MKVAETGVAEWPRAMVVEDPSWAGKVRLSLWEKLGRHKGVGLWFCLGALLDRTAMEGDILVMRGY